MRPVLTAAQSRDQDARAIDPPAVLLDRAGLAVAIHAVRRGAGYGDRVAVLAGPGNNGGDGYVAARYLRQRGVSVDLFPFGDPRTSEAIAARDAAVGAGAVVRKVDQGRSPGLVVDALFGGGFRGELPDLSRWQGVPSLAVDVPSGLDATTGIASEGMLVADSTITFHGPKVGHLIKDGPTVTGELTVARIGLPAVEPEFWECEDSDAPIPRRDVHAHKWSAGSVLVVGGSHGLDGAATLTARAALRAGAGAVMVACPPSVEARIRAPEIMTRAIGDGPSLAEADVAEMAELAARFDVVVVGPGMGGEVGGVVTGLLEAVGGRVLADADALNALDGPAALDRTGSTIITPHAGEFQRLTGEPASYPAATEISGPTVLLKGSPTFVVSGTDRWAVTSGGPELATIGTGDVLAGTVAALWAGGLDAPTAARSGAHWHGVAGAELAARQVVTADQLIDQVGEVLARSQKPSG